MTSGLSQHEGQEKAAVFSNMEKSQDVLAVSDMCSMTAGDQEQIEGRRESPTVKRDIKSRHAQMMAIGGAIGTSFFLATGEALYAGGPAFLFASYALTSCLVYGMVTAVLEIATFLPVPGSSISYYATRFVSPTLGFALGWMYFYSFAVVVAYELTAADIIISYWPNPVPVAAWITICAIIVIVINVFPVKVYGESEFWFAGIKVVLILGLILMGIVLMLGGGPSGEVIGFSYWSHPGAVKAYLIPGAGGRATAFFYTWVLSQFSFNFTPETLVFAAGEIQNPRKVLPSASRRFIIRLAVFYLIGTLVIGAICRSDASGLVSGAGNASASPFVIAVQNAGIRALPAIINAGILTSSCSAGSAYLYMSSRALYSLAKAGNAPKIFARVNSYGLPYYCVMASCLFIPLAYMNVNQASGTVFNWFINMTNTVGWTSWIVACVVYLRFRKACKTQNIELPYRSKLQPWMTHVCMFMFSFMLLINGFTNFYPGQFTASGFLTAYIGVFVFIFIFAVHKVFMGRKDPWWRSAQSVDMVTGLLEVEAEEAAYKELESILEESRGQHGFLIRMVKYCRAVFQ